MKKLIIFGILMIMIMSVLAGCTEEENGNGGDNLEPAPDFQLTDIEGDTFKLSDFQGKVVILDFMATWCGPCKTAMGDLKDVFNNYDSNKVVIISIDIDETETDSMLSDFKDQYGDNWTFAVDYDNEADDGYNIGSIPTLVIVNKQGKISFKNVGVVPYATLKKEIDKLL